LKRSETPSARVKAAIRNCASHRKVAPRKHLERGRSLLEFVTVVLVGRHAAVVIMAPMRVSLVLLLVSCAFHIQLQSVIAGRGGRDPFFPGRPEVARRAEPMRLAHSPHSNNYYRHQRPTGGQLHSHRAVRRPTLPPPPSPASATTPPIEVLPFASARWSPRPASRFSRASNSPRATGRMLAPLEHPTVPRLASVPWKPRPRTRYSRRLGRRHSPRAHGRTLVPRHASRIGRRSGHLSGLAGGPRFRPRELLVADSDGGRMEYDRASGQRVKVFDGADRDGDAVEILEEAPLASSNRGGGGGGAAYDSMKRLRGPERLHHHRNRRHRGAARQQHSAVRYSGNSMIDTLREQNAKMGGWWSSESDGGSSDGGSGGGSDGGSEGGSDGGSNPMLDSIREQNAKMGGGIMEDADSALDSGGGSDDGSGGGSGDGWGGVGDDVWNGGSGDGSGGGLDDVWNGGSGDGSSGGWDDVWNGGSGDVSDGGWDDVWNGGSGDGSGGGWDDVWNGGLGDGSGDDSGDSSGGVWDDVWNGDSGDGLDGVWDDVWNGGSGDGSGGGWDDVWNGDSGDGSDGVWDDVWNGGSVDGSGGGWDDVWNGDSGDGSGGVWEDGSEGGGNGWGGGTDNGTNGGSGNGSVGGWDDGWGNDGGTWEGGGGSVGNDSHSSDPDSEDTGSPTGDAADTGSVNGTRNFNASHSQANRAKLAKHRGTTRASSSRAKPTRHPGNYHGGSAHAIPGHRNRSPRPPTHSPTNHHKGSARAKSARAKPVRAKPTQATPAQAKPAPASTPAPTTHHITYPTPTTPPSTPPIHLRCGVAPGSLQAALDWACGPGGADCSAIQPGGACFQAGNVPLHASFAFNAIFQSHAHRPGSCFFGGNAVVVPRVPNYAAAPPTCSFPSSNGQYCVAACQEEQGAFVPRNPVIPPNPVYYPPDPVQPHYPPAPACHADMGAVQRALDWACGPGGVDCSAVLPGGACWQGQGEGALAVHASHAFNAYFQQNGRQPGTCFFGGTAVVVPRVPDYAAGPNSCSWPSDNGQFCVVGC
ncbi:hypothetical protein CLOM_g18658, partial [Closterium sp. NIES-68]